MSKNTKIEWCDHTFNPWWGCTKVSAGCKNCYASTFANRFGVKWGPAAERRVSSEKVWAEVMTWERAAAKAGTCAKVFCGSMCDWAEGLPMQIPLLKRLFELIQATPNLRWLMLTKRPENIGLIMAQIKPGYGVGWTLASEYPNVWLGASVEDQHNADTRIPALLAHPASIHFLSAEPLLGEIDLGQWLLSECDRAENDLLELECEPSGFAKSQAKVNWVIVGGESGRNARPMHKQWASNIRSQLDLYGVPFFFKQWGEWVDTKEWVEHRDYEDKRYPCHHWSVGTGELFPDSALKVGRKKAGDKLEGSEWHDMPAC